MVFTKKLFASALGNSATDILEWNFGTWRMRATRNYYIRRIHSLELIPGIGKTYMMSIINDREKEQFTSFSDIQSRIGLKDIHKLVTKRIIEEITKETRMTLFVGR